MSLNLAPPPLQTALIESPRTGTITREWWHWFKGITDRVQTAAYAVLTKSLTGQTASIALTALVPQAAGLYRVSYWFRVTTAAGVASSLIVTIHSTEGTVACTQASAAYAGNAVNAPQAGSVLVKCDAGTPLSYSTTYVSNPAAAMTYDLELLAESL